MSSRYCLASRSILVFSLLIWFNLSARAKDNTTISTADPIIIEFMVKKLAGSQPMEAKASATAPASSVKYASRKSLAVGFPFRLSCTEATSITADTSSARAITVLMTTS